MVKAQWPVLLAGSHWCYYRHIQVIYARIHQFYSSEPWVATSPWTVLRLLCHDLIRLALRQTHHAIYKRRPTAETDKPHSSSGKEEENSDSDDQALRKNKDITHLSGANIFQNWAIELLRSRGSFHEDVAEILKTRICAFVSRNMLSQMQPNFKATVPHDYLYGILSTSGITGYPKSLIPNYALPFVEVFHSYTVTILKHTGELSIPSRKTHKLTGVPTWVPDFRSDTILYFEPRAMQQEQELSVNSDVKISEDDRVCITRGVHLGEVIFLLERAYDTGCEVTCFNIISRFDGFLEDACREQQLNKPDVFAEACEAFDYFLEVGPNPVRNIRKVYDDCLSGSLCTSNQCETSVRDILVTLSRTIAETP